MQQTNFLLLLILVVAWYLVEGQVTTKLWPLPQVVQSTGSQKTAIGKWKNFAFVLPASLSAVQAQILSGATNRYLEKIFYDKQVPDAEDVCNKGYICLTSASLEVPREDNVVLDLQSDESYTIHIVQNVAKLSSKSVWETFAQLIQKQTLENTEQEFYGISQFTTPLAIQDEPRFPWRGFMIDTSRHYLSVDMILHLIDAMTYIKLNVLHWHFVDAQSFPLQIPGAPLLSEKGAYSQKYIYSLADVKRVVDYAFQRGVRVVGEIDVPGHAASWGKGYPITANCPKYAGNINNIPLNPALNKTYDIIEAVISNLTSVMPDAYMHFGGDEVVTKCWLEDASIVQFMQQHHIATPTALYAYFEQRLAAIYSKYKKTMVAWQEQLNLLPVWKLPKETVIQVWSTPGTLNVAVENGYRALLSAGFYLDKQQPNINFHPESRHYLFEDTWQDFWTMEPFDWIPATKQDLIIGGEGAMWGEQVDDANIQSRVFPRLLGVAERLWSSKDNSQMSDNVTWRLEFHRCNLVRRGIKSGPVTPSYCDGAYMFD